MLRRLFLSCLIKLQIVICAVMDQIPECFAMPAFQFWPQFFGTDGADRLLLWDCLSTMAVDGCPYEMPSLALIQILGRANPWSVSVPIIQDGIKHKWSSTLWGWFTPSWRWRPRHKALFTYHGNLHLLGMNCLFSLPRASWNTGVIQW